MRVEEEREPRGQSVVEAALTFPVLIMLLLGLLDLGRAYYALVVLRDAAADGAVYAAVSQNPGAITERVRAAESTMLVSMETVAVSVSPGPYGIGESVTVTATYEMPLYTPFVSGLVGGETIALRAAASQPVFTVGY